MGCAARLRCFASGTVGRRSPLGPGFAREAQKGGPRSRARDAPTEPLSKPGRLQVLALSGGGQWGAFGAGFLKGWTRHGDRPAEFQVVTGTSTGALQATFAFLGRDFDDAVGREYLDIRGDSDVMKKRFLLTAASLLGRAGDHRSAPASAGGHHHGRPAVAGRHRGLEGTEALRGRGGPGLGRLPGVRPDRDRGARARGPEGVHRRPHGLDRHPGGVPAGRDRGPHLRGRRRAAQRLPRARGGRARPAAQGRDHPGARRAPGDGVLPGQRHAERGRGGGEAAHDRHRGRRSVDVLLDESTDGNLLRVFLLAQKAQLRFLMTRIPPDVCQAVGSGEEPARPAARASACTTRGRSGHSATRPRSAEPPLEGAGPVRGTCLALAMALGPGGGSTAGGGRGDARGGRPREGVERRPAVRSWTRCGRPRRRRDRRSRSSRRAR
ncbi:MAG: patatin-like phospholipase family protein [Desulfomicrobium escambiense]|nr:patatin-like phospholipase family protein [Desulfomicrobium escambiense]